jgi:hypothetical protein
MRTVQIDRRRSIWLIISLVTALTFVLTACGTNSGSGTTSTGSTPPPTSTSAVNVHGCPSNAVIGTAPTPANVVLKPSNSNTTINAHMGDVIEIQLPFGQMWNGPTTSQGVLQLQTPAGYAWEVANSCVWRFTVQGTGTTLLSFYGKAICKKGAMCPQYIMSLPFTINVK